MLDSEVCTQAKNLAAKNGHFKIITFGTQLISKSRTYLEGWDLTGPTSLILV